MKKLFLRIWTKILNFNTVSFAYLVTFIGFVVTAVFIWVLWDLYSIGGNMYSDDMAQTGQVGDFFGGVVGSIWALAGVFLYFSAIRLQNKELTNQQKRNVDLQYMEQIKQFESTFFNLLNVQHELKNNLTTRFRYTIYNKEKGFIREYDFFSGNEYFNHLKDDLGLLYKYYKNGQYKLDIETSVKKFSKEKATDNDVMKMLAEITMCDLVKDLGLGEEIFEKICSKQGNELDFCKAVYAVFFLFYEPSLGHYCRHLYNLIKYIDVTKGNIKRMIECSYIDNERDKMERDLEQKMNTYIAFLQSGLSTPELVVLFYNSLIFDKARELYIRYNILENLQDMHLFSPSHKKLVPEFQFRSTKDMINEIIHS